MTAWKKAIRTFTPLAMNKLFGTIQKTNLLTEGQRAAVRALEQKVREADGLKSTVRIVVPLKNRTAETGGRLWIIRK